MGAGLRCPRNRSEAISFRVALPWWKSPAPPRLSMIAKVYLSCVLAKPTVFVIPDTSLVLPAVLIAGTVGAARSPDSPLLDGADPSHPMHDVVPVVGREAVEHVVHEVVQILRGAVHKAPVWWAAREVCAVHAETPDALEETAVLVGEPQLVAGRIVAVIEDFVDQFPAIRAEGEAAAPVSRSCSSMPIWPGWRAM